MVLIVGVHKVVCTCGKEMRRTGGVFGGDYPSQDTYYCDDCKKHVIITTPKQEDQEDFVKRLQQYDTVEVETLNKIAFFIKRIWYRNKDGVPHIRDFGAPCFYFEPGPPDLNVFSDCGCDTDGHYLCMECQHRRQVYNCPSDCIHQLRAGGPWDNPEIGGCAIDERLPGNCTLEEDDTLPLCPHYQRLAAISETGDEVMGHKIKLEPSPRQRDTGAGWGPDGNVPV